MTIEQMHRLAWIFAGSPEAETLCIEAARFWPEFDWLEVVRKMQT